MANYQTVRRRAQSEFVSPASGPQSLLQDAFVPQLVELCRVMFANEATVESMVDPAEPSNPWLSFNVMACGSFSDILSRESEWHVKVEQLTGDRTGRYRLSIYPVE